MRHPQMVNKGEEMSDYEYDDENTSDLPKELRSIIKALKAENAALTTEVGSLRGETRKRTLAEEIAKRNLNPKIAGLVPKDLGDDALDEWLTEYGDVFGAGAPAVNQPDPNAAQAAEASRQATAFQGAPSGDPGDLLTRINAAENWDELQAVLKSA
jgi:hypothetical protein